MARRNRLTGYHRTAGKRGFFRRLSDYLFAGLFLAVMALAAAWLAGLSAEVHSGPFRVVDGDSLEAGGLRFRLEGIDAPEYRQVCRRNGGDWACGREAARHLATLVSRSDTGCRSYGEDRYERLLVRCRRGGTDINGAMVEAGFAVAFGDYDREEAEARAAGRGIWAGDFQQPRDWRRLHGGLDETVFGDSIGRWFGKAADRLGAWLEKLGLPGAGGT